MRKLILMICMVTALTSFLACGKKGPPVLREERKAPDKAADTAPHDADTMGGARHD